MSKKGVSAVSGITSPTAGKKQIYNIVGWYPATPQKDRDPQKVTWELFKKRQNGKFTTTNIKKTGTSDFTFGEGAAGETYRLEAYLYNPEGGGLIIKPQPSKIPRINKVELFYVDDTKGIIFNFNETLRAKANCVNMLGKKLIFTLWEDDQTGGGHSGKNMFIDSKPANVDSNGTATVDFSLTTALLMKAARNEGDAQLEFYVTVEYFTNNKHATNNINIKNPYPPSKPKTNEKPAVPKAKGSPAEQKPDSNKVINGIIDKLRDFKDELWDVVESAGTATKEKIPTQEKPAGKSTSEENVKETPKSALCECEQFQLIWGKRVDCKFRRKVVAIAKDLWPDEHKKMANNLMAVFAWETGETFKPDVPNRANSGATGLIQFMPERADEYFGKHTMETVPNYFNSTNPELHNLKRVKEFAVMSAIDQLDYVAKYFKPLKGKKIEFVDFYLQVLFPVSSEKPEHFVFGIQKHKNEIGLPEDTAKVRQKRIDKYPKNAGMDLFADGKISKSEISLSIQPFLTRGQPEIFRKEPQAEAVKETKAVSESIVVTDAGHGIDGDKGASVTADTEAIMALEVETKTAKNLVSLGIKNVRTRTAPLPKQSVHQITYRSNIFIKNKAKVMVSHHLNSATAGDTFLVMYHPAKLNQLNVEGDQKKGHHPTTGGSSAGFLKNSLALGNAIITEVKSLGIKAILREATVPNTMYSSLGILREIDGPENAGVLIEMGSVTAVNTKFLRTNAEGIGKAIATGIANYLKVPVAKKAAAVSEECEGEATIVPVESKTPTEAKKGKWHDPVDNPRCSLYMQSGGSVEPLGKIWGLFGEDIRKEVKRPHTGLDLFAVTGTNIYACVDGTVYNRCWHGGYGNTVTIKVKDPKAFMALKRAYTKQTTREQDSGTYWSDKGDIYLFYAHLNSVKEFTFGQEVASGAILGTTGRSGVTGGTRAPHLHFEIFCEYKMPAGTKYRINPGYFVNYKPYEKQSAAERTEQKTEMDRGKIVGFDGVKKLPHHNEGKFQK